MVDITPCLPTNHPEHRDTQIRLNDRIALLTTSITNCLEAGQIRGQAPVHTVSQVDLNGNSMDLLRASSHCRRRGKVLGQIRRGFASANRHDFFGRPFRDDAAALITRPRTNIDDPVAASNHLHVVLNHDDGIACGNQLLKLPLKSLHVGRMEPRGGLVKHIKALAVFRPLKLSCELHPLRFTAREFGRSLSQTEISEAHFLQDLQRSLDRRIVR